MYKIFLYFATDEWDGWKETERFLDHAFQVVQFVDDLCCSVCPLKSCDVSTHFEIFNLNIIKLKPVSSKKFTHSNVDI
jgi:hypothetical protein